MTGALENWENEGGPVAADLPPAVRLEWAAFIARFYPDARRHDSAPLAAYEAYRAGAP
jgi:hypothetical protein